MGDVCKCKQKLKFRHSLTLSTMTPYAVQFHLPVGFQCAPPNVELPQTNIPHPYQHGQYCQRFNQNHKNCGGESKFFRIKVDFSQKEFRGKLDEKSEKVAILKTLSIKSYLYSLDFKLLNSINIT